jgi:hypothetical protein
MACLLYDWRGLSKRQGYQGLESLDIFRDADQNAKGAFQSVENSSTKTAIPQVTRSA